MPQQISSVYKQAGAVELSKIMNHLALQPIKQFGALFFPLESYHSIYPALTVHIIVCFCFWFAFCGLLCFTIDEFKSLMVM